MDLTSSISSTLLDCKSARQQIPLRLKYTLFPEQQQVLWPKQTWTQCICFWYEITTFITLHESYITRVLDVFNAVWRQRLLMRV